MFNLISYLLLKLDRSDCSGNKYLYYPEDYIQDKNKSIIDKNQKYDLTKFSAHEISIIRQVLEIVKRKYPPNLRALGLVNEIYPIVYKPRYILFEIAVILYSNSIVPEEQLAAAFAYSQKGAMFRVNAINLYEKSINFVDFKTLDLFSSISSASICLNLAELYEKEHKYDEAIIWLKKTAKIGTLNSQYLLNKISQIEDKKGKTKQRKRKPSSNAILFDQQVHDAAMRFVKKFKLLH